MSGMAAFMVAVGGTSLICYLLMNRVQNKREGFKDATYPGIDGSGAHWSLLSRNSSDSASPEDSSSCIDAGGGGDSGGGAD